MYSAKEKQFKHNTNSFLSSKVFFFQKASERNTTEMQAMLFTQFIFISLKNINLMEAKTLYSYDL